MDVNVQCFRKNGIIICVKLGWIAVDIPRHWKIRKAEYIGFSSQYSSSYYDILLNGTYHLHVFRDSLPLAMPFKPYFFEQYPF